MSSPAISATPTQETSDVSRRTQTQEAASDDAERAVLAAVLLVGDDRHRLSTELATVLKPSMFYRGAHRVIYEAMEALRIAGVVVDPVTLSHQLVADGTLTAAGGKEFIGGLLDEIPTAEHVMAHARIVRELWQRRELRLLARQIDKMASDPTTPVDDVFNWASKALAPMTTGQGDRGFRRIKQGLWDATQRIEDRRSGKAVTAIATGFPELDTKLSGGVERGELVIVAGVPSCGKTTLVWNLLRDFTLAKVGATGFVSAEMSEGMLLESALAAESGVARSLLKTGQLTDEELYAIASAAGRLLHQAIYVSDDVMPTIEDVVNRCRLLKAKEPTLCAIGVDFIQLLQKRDRERGELQEATLRHIAYQLKAIALELNVVVIALAQPNDKQIEERPDKRPRVHDLQGSSGMRQAAEHIWLLYRPQMYSPAAADTIEINLAKNKFGAVANVSLKWDGPRLRVVSPLLAERERQAKIARDKPLELQPGGQG